MQNFLQEILQAIIGSFTTLGKAILDLVKHGFIWLFTEYTESSGVYTISGPSAFAYFTFILMGIAIVMGVTALLTHLVRRSK